MVDAVRHLLAVIKDTGGDGSDDNVELIARLGSSQNQTAANAQAARGGSSPGDTFARYRHRFALAFLFRTKPQRVVWGMPGFVARAGLADKILPIDQVAEEITRATTHQVAARGNL